MKDGLENIDKLFKGKLGDFSPEPPQDLWNLIEKNLDPARKPVISWFNIAASVVVLAAAGITLWLTTGDKQVLYMDDEFTSEVTQQDQISNDQNLSSAIILDENNLSITDQVSVENNNDLQKFEKSEITEENVVLADAQKYVYNNQSETQDEILVVASNFENETDENIDEVILTDENSISNKKPNLSAKSLIAFNTQSPDYTLAGMDYSNGFNIEQNVKEEKQRKIFTKISYGAHLSPSFSYRNSGSTAVDGNSNPIAASGGLYVETNLTERLYIKTGAYYLQYNNLTNIYRNRRLGNSQNFDSEFEWELYSVPVREEFNSLYFENAIGEVEIKSNTYVDEENQLVVDDNISSGQLNANRNYSSISSGELDDEMLNNSEVVEKIDDIGIQKFNTFEFPIQVRYYFIDKNKIKVNAITGLSVNFITKSYIYSKKERLLIAETVNIDLFNVSGSVGIGLEYPVFKKISITLEPTVKYFLNAMNLKGNEKIHPYTFGVYSGIRFTL